MEKRAVLAFVLIIGVWVAYYYLVYPSVAPAPDKVPAISTDSSSAGREPTVTSTGNKDAAAAVSASPSPASVTPGSDLPTAVSQESWDRQEQLRLLENDSTEVVSRRQIVVESESFRGVLDTEGGVIRSWKLKKYRGIGEPWVEIIPEAREFGPDVILTTEEGPLSFSRLVFQSDSQDIQVNAVNRQATIEFRGLTASGLRIVKRYVFNHDDYAFKLEIELSGGESLPLGSKYYVRWGGGLRITESEWTYDVAAFRGFAMLGDAVIEQDIGASVEDPKPEDSGEAKWVGVRSKYFLAAVIAKSRSGKGVRLNGRPITEGTVQDRQISAEISMGLSGMVSDEFLMYLGPVHYDTLLGYGVGLENTVDLGWSFIRPVSGFVLDLLVWLRQFISNYGLVIILLSIIVKVVLYPLTYKSMKASMDMQRLQPNIEALREKHKNDAQKLNQEMMKLYRESGVNPLGGCLPLVLQMPILYALYAIFSSTIELRNAPFVAWIVDLSLKDQYYVLPILMGVTMFIQSKMSMKDPRQAVFIYIMPVMLFFFMMDLPAGLILYWTMVNILTILQQGLQERFFPPSSVAT